MRLADYVPFMQLKKLKADGVPMTRDFEFGVQQPLQEVDEDDLGELQQKPKHYVRPIEIDVLSVRTLDRTR
jgi:hypothetical protein